MDERNLPSSGPSPDPGPIPGVGVGGPFLDSDGETDFDEWAAWLDQEIAAGRNPVPSERAPESQGISVCLSDAEGIDQELLAAITSASTSSTSSTSGGRAGTGLGPQFGQDAAADVLPPGPALTALTEAAVADVARLSDDQLIGVLHAARRQENREAWKKALVTAEFARRREAEFKAAQAEGVPVHCRPGQFPGEELAMELLLGPVQASRMIDDAADLATRLPATLAGMAAGLIDEARAGVIAFHTRSMTADDAALADGILAALAPGLRLDRLAAKAYALEMKLAPEAVKARREHARRTRQRVEVRREESGNASIAGREMDTGDALAAKAHIHALALRLRRAGIPGTLDRLRLLVFSDLTAGRDPLSRLAGPDGQHASQSDASQDDARQDKASANKHNPDSSRPTPDGPASGTPVSAPESVVDDLLDDLAPADPWNDRPPADPRDDREPSADDRAHNSPARPADDLVPATDRMPDNAFPPGAVRETGTKTRHDGEARDHNRPSALRPTEDNLVSARGRDRDCNPIPISPGGGTRSLDYRDDDSGEDPDVSHQDPRPPAPMPATINLVVHAGTLFGWDTTPTEAGGWGLLDADETRAIVEAASRHTATRWCLTLVGRDGTAAAHGCSPGQHPWAPHSQQDGTGASGQQYIDAGTADQGGSRAHSQGIQGPDSSAGFTRWPRPTPAQAARLAEFLRGLNLTLKPIAKGECGHVTAESRYTPSRRLTHLVRARTATCDAPGCAAQAVHADLDHTTPYPEGPTDQCNLGPKCRRHHKTKQAPGWKVEQPEPGVIRWTLPSGRTHTTKPTVYGAV